MQKAASEDGGGFFSHLGKGAVIQSGQVQYGPLLSPVKPGNSSWGEREECSEMGGVGR